MLVIRFHSEFHAFSTALAREVGPTAIDAKPPKPTVGSKKKVWKPEDRCVRIHRLLHRLPHGAASGAG
ncbi:MAG: hypothetical protein ABSB74_01705 [Tepidisphaeraceae bacterium]